MNEIVAIFDFCETLVDFQTADAFVDYIRENLKHESIEKKERLNIFLRKTRLPFIVEKLTFNLFSIEKRLKLRQLRGVPYNDIDFLSKSFYEDCIKPHLIPETNIILRQHISAGHQVWIVSGGYGIYLRHYANDNNIHLVSSNIEFKNAVCTGRMLGADCMRENKVRLLKKKLGFLGDYLIIASYSDSVSDIPILSIAKQGVVVSKSHNAWVESKGFNEIIIK